MNDAANDRSYHEQVETNKMRFEELRSQLLNTYTPEGVEVWIADMLTKAEQMVDALESGAFL